MALTPTDRWVSAARAGTAEPVLLFEFRPTVLYDEKCCRADWSAGTRPAALDVEHPGDELRLKRNREVAHPEKQTSQEKAWHPSHYVKYVSTGRTLAIAPRASLVQTFRSRRSFRLKKLRLGLRNESRINELLYSDRITVRLMRGLREPAAAGDSSGTEAESHIDRILDGAEQIGAAEVDFGPNGELELVADEDGVWHEIDFSGRDVWVPGADETCAILIEPEDSFHLGTVSLRGSSGAGKYPRGSLYRVDPDTGAYLVVDGDLSFKFMVDGYDDTGSHTLVLDMGEPPAAGLEGELQLSYCAPRDTGVLFQAAEAGNPAELETRPLREVSDGSRISKRYIKLRITLYSDPDGIDTPRIYSVRGAYHRPVRMLMARRPLFGYPNLVAEAPDYSAEGEPLGGEASSTDTSRIVLLDPGGLAGRLFAGHDLKNDEVRIYLGFDTPGFRDIGGQGSECGDWLPFKTVWIEDWEPGEGWLAVHGYDQQVRFRQAEAPAVVDDEPEASERLYYDLMSPAAIKRDLLARARIRPSRVDCVSGPDGEPLASTSFGRLNSSFGWTLAREVDRPTGLHSLDSELNKHLLAFQLVDERGRWVVRHADFDPEIDPGTGLWSVQGEALPCLGGDDLLTGSESYSPGLKHLRNYGVVFFGARGGDETQYPELAVSAGEQSARRHKEYAPDKLVSRFIPPGAGTGEAAEMARQVAHRRRLLQQDGVRTVEFSTGLRFAHLQIGDHINFNSKRYARPGAWQPNPLLLMLTRKNIDRNLGSIHWSGLVLLDAAQSAEDEPAVSPPAGFNVTVTGEGEVRYDWQASPDEQQGGVARYEIMRRLSHLGTWGPARHRVAADGSADYALTDSSFGEPLQYDFAVRAVSPAGVSSELLARENVAISGQLPATPDAADWELSGAAGAVELRLVSPVAGATHYRVYTLGTSGMEPLGSFTDRGSGSSFTYQVPEPDRVKVHIIILRAANRWGESEGFSLKAALNRVRLPAGWTPSAPSFDTSGGTYPLLSRVAVGPHQAFSITLMVRPAEEERDLIGRYELQRCCRESYGGQRSEWLTLPDYDPGREDSGQPAASVFYYQNTDRLFKPGWYYSYRIRAVAASGMPGPWSAETEVQLTDDTTPPDMPQVSAIEMTGQNQLLISEPSVDGGPCPDFSHFLIEGYREGAPDWEVLDAHYRGTVFYHAVEDAYLGVDWRYRVTAFDHSGNSSATSAATGNAKQKKASGPFLADEVNDTLAQVAVNEAGIALKASKASLISEINVCPEGVRIGSSRISVSGSTEFAGGYDPSSKLPSLGGRYDSSSSGARVRIFPDNDTGIQVVDSSGTDVFRAVVGGEDEGDVVLGDPDSSYVRWDNSFNMLMINGYCGTTGGLYTSSGSNRIAIGNIGGAEKISFCLDGAERGALGSDGNNIQLIIDSKNDKHRATYHHRMVKFEYDGGGGFTTNVMLQQGLFGGGLLTLYNAAGTSYGGLAYDSLKIGGAQVVGQRQPAIGDPSGGSVIDAEARSAISAILAALRSHGLIES